MPWPHRTTPVAEARGTRRLSSGRVRLAVVLLTVAAALLALAGAAGAGAFASARGGAAHDGRVSGAAEAPPASQALAGPRAAGHSAGARTSCTSVAHIGDSTSVGMVSPATLPDPHLRLRDQYRDVGVRRALIDASGGRSIVEEMPGQVNGYRVATAWHQQGFRGCWVIALGTNDIANIAVGSAVGAQARIHEMMTAAHGEPVMWVDTQTDLSSGPWSESNMQRWNSALRAACSAYPNMRIFDWASMVRPAWHLPDGIHYTAAGYAIRARAIAHALVRAFPAHGHSDGCVVR